MADGVRAQRRADEVLLALAQRRGERAGAEDHHELVGLAHGLLEVTVAAEGDARLTARDAGLDHRRGVHPLVEHDGEALLDVVLGDPREDLGAVGIEGQRHEGAVLLRVHRHLRVGDHRAVDLRGRVDHVGAPALHRGATALTTVGLADEDLPTLGNLRPHRLDPLQDLLPPIGAVAHEEGHGGVGAAWAHGGALVLHRHALGRGVGGVRRGVRALRRGGRAGDGLALHELVDERRVIGEDLELQPRGAADDLADLVEVRAVLTGHLDDDGLAAGGDGGLAHGELVDAVGDRLDRLPHGVLFELGDLVLLERESDLVAAA